MKNIIILIEKNSLIGFGCAWIFYYYYYLLNNKNIKYALKYIFVDSLEQEISITEFSEYSSKIGCYKAYSFGINYLEKDIDTLKNIFPNIMIYNSEEQYLIKAWEHLFPNKEIPLFLKYMQDGSEKEIYEGMKHILTIGDFNIWTEFINNETQYLNKSRELGTLLLNYKEQKYAVLMDEGRVMKINGQKVFIVNSTEYDYDLGEYICQTKEGSSDYMVDYVLIWNYYMLETKFKVHLISRKNSDINVLEIARRYDEKSVGTPNCAKFYCHNIFDLISEKNV